MSIRRLLGSCVIALWLLGSPGVLGAAHLGFHQHEDPGAGPDCPLCLAAESPAAPPHVVASLVTPPAENPAPEAATAVVRAAPPVPGPHSRAPPALS
jgi:hypothetical protein